MALSFRVRDGSRVANPDLSHPTKVQNVPHDSPSFSRLVPPILRWRPFGLLLAGCLALHPLTASAGETAAKGIDIDAAIAALAQDAPDLAFVLLVRLLQQRGYAIESVTTTMLGRVRIVAVNALHRRELVVSRASGQVLRDALVKVFRDDPDQVALPPLPSDYFLFPRVGSYPEVPK